MEYCVVLISWCQINLTNKNNHAYIKYVKKYEARNLNQIQKGVITNGSLRKKM